MSERVFITIIAFIAGWTVLDHVSTAMDDQIAHISQQIDTSDDHGWGLH
jgi:hypothetical protein